MWLSYLAISAPIALWLFIRQNKGQRLGGPISNCKGLWLYWTISVWFFLIPIALTHGDWPAAAWWAWGGLSVSMWVRGIAEIYMLFVTKNWTPKIGITHDLVTLAWVIGASLWQWESLHYAAWWIQLFTLALAISLAIETWYAWAFLQLVRERTKGKEGIWYATKEDPKFRLILNVTTTFNTILYMLTALFVWRWFT
jgi:hypothetical protein